MHEHLLNKDNYERRPHAFTQSKDLRFLQFIFIESAKRLILPGQKNGQAIEFYGIKLKALKALNSDLCPYIILKSTVVGRGATFLAHTIVKE